MIQQLVSNRDTAFLSNKAKQGETKMADLITKIDECERHIARLSKQLSEIGEKAIESFGEKSSYFEDDQEVEETIGDLIANRKAEENKIENMIKYWMQIKTFLESPVENF